MEDEMGMECSTHEIWRGMHTEFWRERQKRPLRRLRPIRMDNIKMNLREIAFFIASILLCIMMCFSLPTQH
jgi:hypothetical protein